MFSQKKIEMIQLNCVSGRMNDHPFLLKSIKNIFSRIKITYFKGKTAHKVVTPNRNNSETRQLKKRCSEADIRQRATTSIWKEAMCKSKPTAPHVVWCTHCSVLSPFCWFCLNANVIRDCLEKNTTVVSTGGLSLGINTSPGSWNLHFLLVFDVGQ